MLQLRNTEFVKKQLILIEKMKGPNFIEKYFIIIQVFIINEIKF